ncbi:MMPL/RND family transporter [Mycobacterium sp. URHB0021]
MLRRARSAGALEGAGLPALGRMIVRHPWLVIAGWLALVATLLLAVPPLVVVAQQKPPGLLPEGSSVLAAINGMQDAFHESGTGNGAIVVLSNENGLTKRDEQTYRTLVDALKADTKSVTGVQDFFSTPEIRPVMTSQDVKAWQLPVSLSGTMGEAGGQQAYRSFIETVREKTAGTTLKANVIGASATVDDLNNYGTEDAHVIEIATVVIVLAILIAVYRNVVAMIVPFLMIAVALGVAQGAVAGLGELGVIGLGPQTLVLMTAMMVGAGTDYAIFLFSRYHDGVRSGLSSDDAVIAALGSIGKVIAGSAGTVAITFMGLAFTKLGVFSTVGPALSVTVGVGFLASITLLPAILVLVGRRGWIKPRKELTARFWRRSGIRIVRRPVPHLAVSLVILIALASSASLIKYNYDDRKNLPADAESNLGYDALANHFPVSTTVPAFLFIQSKQDLRTPKALADMEEMARRIAQLPDMYSVRGITRPTGDVLEQAKATYQAGEVGSKLGDVSKLINQNDTSLNTLAGGQHQMADTLDQLRNGVLSSLITIRPLVQALAAMQQQLGGSKTLEQVDTTASLVENMRALGQALGVNTTRISDIYSWAIPMVNALNVSPTCNADPSCAASRYDLQRLTAPENGALVQRITVLGRALEGTDGTQTLDQTLRDLSQSMQSTTEAARQLGLDNPDSVGSQLANVEQGANLLADSSRALAIGTQLLVDQTKAMGGGLDQASAFLMAMKQDAANPSAAGFYIPPQILTQAEFKKAAALFVSADGHSARYMVQTALNPFGTEAMSQVQEIIDAAQSARPNTTLADAKISMIGFAPVQNDIRNFYNGDIRFIFIVTLVVVFLILTLLLRSLVAPIYLVGSVIISYLSAIGVGVLFFQYILRQEISWSVPGLTFLVLVAVGADYNLLLISRIREEAHRGTRTAVVRTIGATGGVITSAGLIFAASMFGLTFSSIAAMVQIGFVIGVGLLLDTFVVRTITVPAIAVLLGNGNWWPSKGHMLRKRKRFGQEQLEDDSAPEASDSSALGPKSRKCIRAEGRRKNIRRIRLSTRSPARPVGSGVTY